MRPQTTAFLLLALATLCWAGNFVLGRAMYAEIPPFTFNFWRWFGAMLILAPFVAPSAWQHRQAIRSHWRILTVLALLGITVFNSLAYTALNTTTAVNAALIVASLPVVIMILSFVIYRDRITRRQGVGLALSLVGVVIIVIKGDWAVLAALDVNAGDIWMTVGVFVWALYCVLLRDRPKDLPPLVFLFAITVIGVAFLAPIYGLELAVKGGIALTLDNLLSLAYVSVFASVVAYIAWNRGVAEVGANRAGFFSHLMPVFATILAVVLLNESLFAYHAAGVGLIGSGLALATIKP
ncbi:MAG: DMT family transporter [Rhodospirillales bacterium]|nr:DMT family transporter [Rhodospirillales bacterium]